MFLRSASLVTRKSPCAILCRHGGGGGGRPGGLPGMFIIFLYLNAFLSCEIFEIYSIQLEGKDATET